MYEVQVTITVNTQSRSEAFAEVWEAVSLLPHGNDAILESDW